MTRGSIDNIVPFSSICVCSGYLRPLQESNPQIHVCHNNVSSFNIRMRYLLPCVGRTVATGAAPASSNHTLFLTTSTFTPIANSPSITPFSAPAASLPAHLLTT